VARRSAERLLAAIDGKRCLLEVSWEARVPSDELGRFMRATFGLVVFAPRAVEALETTLSGVEICRWPSAPYAIERSYWENMVALRRHAVSELPNVDGVDRFRRMLRELHVLAVMGTDLQSFYKPASPASDHAVAPGAWYLDAPRILETERGNVFLDGPRVKVPLLGGAAYHRAVCAELGDDLALAEERAHESGGISWGRVLKARSEKDAAAGPWFCPPRPLSDGHLESLCSSLCKARDADDRETTISALARFHQCFVQLHPFRCANQSLAMNLVNALLVQTHGAGIPHLLLDHFALRLSPDAYATLFRRAVTAFLLPDDDAARRLATLRERKARAFALIEQLARTESVDQGSAIVSDDTEAAHWALIR
jgi:hypothetical protein